MNNVVDMFQWRKAYKEADKAWKEIKCLVASIPLPPPDMSTHILVLESRAGMYKQVNWKGTPPRELRLPVKAKNTVPPSNWDPSMLDENRHMEFRLWNIKDRVFYYMEI